MTQETCHGCGAPLRYHQHACDYCRRVSLVSQEKRNQRDLVQFDCMIRLEEIKLKLLLGQQPLTVLAKTG